MEYRIFECVRKVVGGNGSGTPTGFAPYAVAAFDFYTEDIGTMLSADSTANERLETAAFTFIKPVKGLGVVHDISKAKDVGKGVSKVPSDFADRAKLEGYFDKRGNEFSGIYKNADEYLKGAKSVIKNGIEVQYENKGELRTGYVKYMGNNKNGKAKFEFVGTNKNDEITTYRTQSGKKFWKTINGENIPVINPVE